MHAVAEAARNVAASGARPIAATNCLNFGSPEKPEVMWQFSQAIDGIGEACTALGTPITGGNVSFYNETLGQSIYPTPVLGVLGVLPDASRVMKIGFRKAGDRIVLLDGTTSITAAQHAGPLDQRDTAREFSSSEYAKRIGGIVAGQPPTIDLAAEKRLIDCLVETAAQGLAASAHDVSDGGIAVTLAESCFAAGVRAQQVAPQLGLMVTVEGGPAAESAIFGERGARCVVSVRPEKVGALRAIAAQYGVAAQEIGQVTQDPWLRIEYKGRSVIDSSVESLRDIWTNSLERTLKS
jgi:phosphoribosylformylglycinamidine synthase